MPPPRSPARVSLPRRLLYALVPVMVLLGLAELVARLLHTPAAAPTDRFIADVDGGAGGTVVDPDYGWRLRPHHDNSDAVLEAWERRWRVERPPEPDRFSAHSFRDTPLATPRPPEQRRVLVLGDSSAFGAGVRASDRFSEVLQRRLDPEGTDAPPADRSLEIINAAVPGWSSYQSLQMLRDSLHLGLDALIVYSLNSDLMPARGPLSDAAYFPLRRRMRALDGLGRLALVRALRSLRAPAPPAPAGGLRVPRENYRENIAAMVALAESQGIQGVLVVPTVEAHLSGPPPPSTAALRADSQLLHDDRSQLSTVLAELAEQSQWPLVDGPVLFREAHDRAPERYRGERALFVDGLHPAPAGHALLAEAIYPHLRDLLEATPPWSQRVGQVPAHAPPAWLGAEPTAAPAAARTAAPAPDALQELSCSGGPPDPETTLLDLTLAGVAPTTPVLVTLLRPGPLRDTEWRYAHCRHGRGRLLVPAVGAVRVTALVDADNSGPSLGDPATSLGHVVDLEPGATLPLRLDLQDGLPVPDVAPPFGLYHGAYPLLAHLASDRYTTELRRRSPAELGLVSPLEGEGALALLQVFEEVNSIAEAEGLFVKLSDTLDRPQTPRGLYDGLVVVEPLGGSMAKQVRRELPGLEWAEAWTDRDGLQWTILVQQRPLEGTLVERDGGAVLLSPGEGRLGGG